MANTIKIMSWNANGLLNHQQGLQAILDINKFMRVLFQRQTLLNNLLLNLENIKFTMQLTPAMQPEVELR